MCVPTAWDDGDVEPEEPTLDLHADDHSFSFEEESGLGASMMSSTPVAETASKYEPHGAYWDLERYSGDPNVETPAVTPVSAPAPAPTVAPIRAIPTPPTPAPPARKRVRKVSQGKVSAPFTGEGIGRMEQSLVKGSLTVSMQPHKARNVAINIERQATIKAIRGNLSALQKATGVNKEEAESFLKVVLRANTKCPKGILGWLKTNNLDKVPGEKACSASPGVELTQGGDLKITIGNDHFRDLWPRM